LAIRFTEGYAAAAPILKQALSAFRRETLLPPQEARWLWLACWVAADLWDDETWTLLSTRQLQLVRDVGALTAIPFALSVRSAVQAISGELTEAASMVEEIRAVIEATGIPFHPYTGLWLAALRGQEVELSELIETTVHEAIPRGEGFVLAFAEFASAVLYNSLGRYDAALAAVGHAGEHSYEMGYLGWMVVELIEAAARSGKPELAADALGRLLQTTAVSGTDWALGVEARSRALLTECEAAEPLYRQAIERLERTRIRVELARAHLLYGEWLRRERRRIDAREQLRRGHELFTEFGMEAFAERARVELEATGEHARKRTVETRDELTPQEAQISRLAAEGATNQEIAAQLFISPSTVDYHLRKAFRKLGVKSRHQLKQHLL
jgi:DNA-binding CsgD family transcriptional regulator